MPEGRRIIDPSGVLIVGNGCVALCTGWLSPEKFVSKYPEVVDRASIIGGLQGPAGLSLMLLNLAANPDITNVVVYASDGISRKSSARRGIEALFLLANNGVDDENYIIGADPRIKINRGIPSEMVNKIRKGVRFEDSTDLAIEELIAKFRVNDLRLPYMEPVRLELIPAEPGDTLPSEKRNLIGEGKSISDAWKEAVFLIMRLGDVRDTQGGARQKELQDFIWTIHEPNSQIDVSDVIVRASGISTHDVMAGANLISQEKKPEGIAYTYGERLFDFNGINQVEAMVSELTKSKFTRRAAAVLWDPLRDSGSADPPCMDLVQVIEQEGKLNMIVYFRSQDMLKAGMQNAVGCARLMETMASKLHLSVGSLAIHVGSAHIYSDEWERAQKFVEEKFLKAKPRLVFNPSLDVDPRGSAAISLKDGKIRLQFTGLDGVVFFDEKFLGAEEAKRRIGQLHLVGSLDHAVYVGQQLGLAQLALRTGLPYKQESGALIREVKKLTK